MLEESLGKSLVIIGEEDAVLGFQALGFKVYALRDPADLRFTLEEAVNQKAAVCLVQDNIYKSQAGQINEYRDLALPIFIPFTKDTQNDLLNEIIKNIRMRATGTF